MASYGNCSCCGEKAIARVVCSSWEIRLCKACAHSLQKDLKGMTGEETPVKRPQVYLCR